MFNAEEGYAQTWETAAKIWRAMHTKALAKHIASAYPTLSPIFTID